MPVHDAPHLPGATPVALPPRQVLVVILALVALVAVLIPVVDAARAAALRRSCLARLAQVGAASLVYSGEDQGRILLHAVLSDQFTHAADLVVVVRYWDLLGVSAGPEEFLPGPAFARSFARSSLARCPAWEVATYRGNAALPGSLGTWDAAWPGNLRQIADPGRTLFATCARQAEGPGGVAPGQLAPRRLHRGVAVLTLDGAVGRWKADLPPEGDFFWTGRVSHPPAVSAGPVTPPGR